MNIFDLLLSFSIVTTTVLKELVLSDGLKECYRKNKTDFTRKRILTYDKMLLLLLQKGVKSLQLRLNEFATKLDEKIASDVAFIKARSKILPEVFLNLNKKVIINRFYNITENKAGFETIWDMRILAIDGSKIRLPNTEEITKTYGKVKVVNRNKEESYYTSGLLSVLHDPLNNLALDGILEKGNYSERALAIRNIQNLETLDPIGNNDLIIMDRGYFSSFLAAVMESYGKEFLFRLRKGAIKQADELFHKNSKLKEKIITLEVNNLEEKYKEKYSIVIKKKVHTSIKIRLIRVILDDGEVEVLASSLLDQEIYPHGDFKELYYERWGVEIFYDIIKNRLGLENFSGETNHSILQDLYSTIFLSNYETIMTRANNYQLKKKCVKKKNKNQQKVNKNISFNTIKNTLIELLLEDVPIEKTMEKVMGLFEKNPTQIRPGRKSPRGTTAYRSLNFHKRQKKHCF